MGLKGVIQYFADAGLFSGRCVVTARSEGYADFRNKTYVEGWISYLLESSLMKEDTIITAGYATRKGLGSASILMVEGGPFESCIVHPKPGTGPELGRHALKLGARMSASMLPCGL